MKRFYGSLSPSFRHTFSPSIFQPCALRRNPIDSFRTRTDSAAHSHPPARLDRPPAGPAFLSLSRFSRSCGRTRTAIGLPCRYSSTDKPFSTTLFSSLGSGGPYCALSTSFGRPQTECPLANMQYHLGYVDIRIILLRAMSMIKKTHKYLESDKFCTIKRRKLSAFSCADLDILKKRFNSSSLIQST